MLAAIEWVQTNIISALDDAAASYGLDNPVFLVLFISCFALIIFGKERNKRGYDLLAVYSAFLLVLVLFNPLILSRFDGSKELFALFPMCVIMACAIASKHDNVSGKLRSCAIDAVLALLIVVTGLTLGINEYADPVNNYKIDDQGLIIAQCISEDSGGAPVTVCYVLRDGEHQGDDISACQAAEQYTALIKTKAIPVYEDVDLENAEYLVINDEIIDAGSIDKTGYTVILDTGFYTVFGRT